MHALTELPAWERLLKKIVWEQLGPLSGLRILDFGSGQGVTASHFARDNRIVAVEPSPDMLADAWTDPPYEQVIGGVTVGGDHQGRGGDGVGIRYKAKGLGIF